MKTEKRKVGFTITELLTVMSIIALLLGILVPALNMVRRIAKDTRQKAQFHSIAVALEAYAGDMEEYPGSTIQPNDKGEPTGSDPFTVGAHRLAEALLGRDFLGLDPWTTWDAAADYGEPNIYTGDPSLDRRKGPYLDPESVEAYQIGQLYDDTTNSGAADVYPGNLNKQGVVQSGFTPAPVLTDSYRVKTVMLPNQKQVKAGTPILYYKANTLSRILFDPNGTILDEDAAASIYNSLDNEELVKLGVVTDQTQQHHFDPAYDSSTGRQLFYNAITNPRITTQLRPYNQKSYILISAGFDGVFGTPDDIYNFRE